MSKIVAVEWSCKEDFAANEQGIQSTINTMLQSLVGVELSDASLALWILGMEEQAHVPHEYKNGCIQSGYDINGFEGATFESKFSEKDSVWVTIRTDDGYEPPDWD